MQDLQVLGLDESQAVTHGGQHAAGAAPNAAASGLLSMNWGSPGAPQCHRKPRLKAGHSCWTLCGMGVSSTLPCEFRAPPGSLSGESGQGVRRLGSHHHLGASRLDPQIRQRTLWLPRDMPVTADGGLGGSSAGSGQLCPLASDPMQPAPCRGEASREV